MERVMSGATKIIVDNEGSSSLMYLPLDKLLEKNRDDKPVTNEYGQDVVPYKPATEDSTRDRRAPRVRGIR
jgi:membrane protease subunit HflK